MPVEFEIHTDSVIYAQCKAGYFGLEKHQMINIEIRLNPISAIVKYNVHENLTFL